jgi:hypothetical protein
MKNFIFASLLLCTTFAHAQTLSKKELVDLSIQRLFPDGESLNRKAKMDDLIVEWNKLFDEQIYKRDRNKHRMDWSTLYPIREAKIHEITGKRVFYGVAVKKYNYRIIQDPLSNSLIVNVKMHFYPSKTYLKRAAIGKKDYYDEATLMKIVKENVSETQLIWNRQAPKGVKFKFDMVDTAAEADYSIKLKSIFGALYDKFIVAPAYASILSHEVGHMMGLDDEYSMITSNVLQFHTMKEMVSGHERHMDYTAYKDMRCNLESIMCLRDTIYPYHLDHILGRIELE